ncbi:MAG TPA: alpha/beta hydrolase [Anaeromyxobacter sp.]|nr:alpha/beta hydrolase [Anaeromyxobacter sp.]
MSRRARLAALLGSAMLACAHVPEAPVGPGERIFLVDGEAGRLRVSDGGVGEPALVFVHGLGGDLELWRAQLAHLRTARRTVAWDLRGHGGSDRARDGVYTVDALAADLEAVLHALGIRRAVLVGHSLGGAVLTAFAGAHPDEVAGLLYLDAVGDFSTLPKAAVAEGIAREASPGFGKAERRAVFEQLLDGYARPATRTQVLAALDRMDPAAFAQLRRSVAELDAPRRLGAYAGPRLALEAERSRNPSMASQVLGLQRLEVPGVSHWIMLDDPAAVDKVIDRFLLRVVKP